MHNAAHSLCRCIVGEQFVSQGTLASISPASKQVRACSCDAANVGRYWQILAGGATSQLQPLYVELLSSDEEAKRVAPLLDLEEPAALSGARRMVHAAAPPLCIGRCMLWGAVLLHHICSMVGAWVMKAQWGALCCGGECE